MDLGKLTLELAKPFEGTVLELETPDGRKIEMKLDEVTPYDTNVRRRVRGTPERNREPFAMYFLTAEPEPLPQGMYTLRSEKMTLDNVFIVPVGKDEEGVEYEAIFT